MKNGLSEVQWQMKTSHGISNYLWIGLIVYYRLFISETVPKQGTLRGSPPDMDQRN